MKGEKPLRSRKIKPRTYTVTCDGLEGMQVCYILRNVHIH